MNLTQHIIFDLDGTLIDSRNEIITAYQQVFERIPPAIMPDVSQLNYGLSIRDLLAGVYNNNEELISNGKSLFASIYDSSVYDDTLLYNDVLETLEKLQQNGFVMHIATNKRHFPTMRILKQKKCYSILRRSLEMK